MTTSPHRESARRSSITRARRMNRKRNARRLQLETMEDRRLLALISGVTIEDFSSELNGFGGRLAEDSINGSGLSGGMHNNNAADMWETEGTLEAPNDTAPWHITYDLEGNYELNDIHVWNYNEAASNLFQLGAKDVEIYISPSDNVADLVKLDNAGGDFVFPQANGLNTYTGFSVDTSNVANAQLLDNARLVRFNILSAYTDNNGLTGLSEVQFDGTPVGLISGVTIEDVSSELTTSFNRDADYVLDGSGITNGAHGVTPDGTMWLNSGNGCCADPADPTTVGTGAVITFDLEGNYDLDRFHVWNYNETQPNLNKRGANLVEILVADSVGGSFTSLGNFNFAQATGLADYTGETIDLSSFAAADDARLVRFNIQSNHVGDNEFIGLSEVQFFAAPAAAGPFLQVDVQAGTGTTETDWQALTTTAATNFNTSEGVITVTVNGTPFNQGPVSLDGGGLTIADVYNDFFFTNGASSMSVDIAGLTPNASYDITFYEWQSTHVMTSTIQPRVGSNTSGSSVNLVSSAAAPTSDGQYSASGTWTSTDGSLEIDFIHVSSPSFGQDLIRINGFEISVSDVDSAPPTLNLTNPADGSTSVSPETNLVVTFDEVINKGAAGDIVIKRVADDSIVETIPVSSGAVTVSDVNATINPSLSLDPDTDFYVEIAAGAFEDLSGNAFAGISGNSAWNFMTSDVVLRVDLQSGAGVTQPGWLSMTGSPVSTSDSSLTITANGIPHNQGAASSNGGGLSIADVYNDFFYTNGSPTMNVDIAGLTPNTAYEITFYEWQSGHAMTSIIQPRSGTDTTGSSVTLESLTTAPTTDDQYAATGTWTSTDGSLEIDFVHVSSPTFGQDLIRINGFEVTVAPNDAVAPTISGLNPADDSADVSPLSNLVATFDEDVQKGASGDVVIKRVDDDSIVETIPVTSSAVSVSGASVTIDPSSSLEANTAYYVEIAAGAIEDIATNPFAGISGNSAWNFTTSDILLRVDLQAATGTTQNGWVSMTGSNLVTNDGSLSVNVSGTPFDQNSPANNGGSLSIADVYNDFFFINAADPVITVDIDGLEPNTAYEINWYEWQTTFDITSTIQPRAGSNTTGDIVDLVSLAAAPASDDAYSTGGIWTSTDGSLEIDITHVSDTYAPSDLIRLNGFTISLPPDVPTAPVAIDDTATFSENTDPTVSGLLTLDSLPTGDNTFVADGQTFTGNVESHDGSNWLLIGRGREGWEFDTDGQGNIGDVNQNLGTNGAFAPAAYSDAMINDLLDQAGLTMSDVEIRVKRAADLNGSSYQDFRWRDFNRSAFTWDIEDSPYVLTQEIKDLAGLPGHQEGLVVTVDTNDNFQEGAGDDADRIFTWAWSGHSNQKGFSYGNSIRGNNNGNDFLWDDQNNGSHAIGYAEIYIRALGGTQPTLVSNDFDANNDAVTVTGAATSGEPTAGTLSTTSTLGAAVVVASDGTFTYNPSGVAAIQALSDGQTVIDTFTYLIDDGNGGTDWATVNVSVDGVSDLADDSATVSEDSTGETIDVLANDGLPGSLISGVSVLDFSTEFPNRNAVDTVNGTGLVGGVHNTDVNSMWLSNNEETPLITFDLGANYDLSNFHVWNYNEVNLSNRSARDVEIWVSPDTNTANLVKLDNAGGDFVFAQAPGANGYAGFNVDLSGVTNTTALNGARLVRFDIKSDHGGDNFTGLSEVHFFSAPPLNVDSVTENTDGGAGGTVTITNGGEDVSYNPNGQFESLAAGETATDTFSYSEPGGTTATVTVTINGVNDTPTAVDDTNAITEQYRDESGNTVSGNIITGAGSPNSTADSDPDASDVLTIDPADVTSFAGTYGTLTLASDGSYTYELGATPAQNTLLYSVDTGSNVIDTFPDLTVSDGNGGSADSTLTISITGTDDNVDPVISQGDAALTVTMSEDGTPTSFVAPALDATDGDADTLTWSVSSAATNGTASVSGTGASPTTFTYAPNANYHGADSFTIEVSDGYGGTDSITIDVTIDQVNDAAVFSGDLSGEGVNITGTLTANDPIDGMTTPNYTVISQGSLGTATIDNTTGEWTFTANTPIVLGDDAFTVQVTDDDGNLETQVINITVSPVYLDNDGNLIAESDGTVDRFIFSNAGGGQVYTRFDNVFYGPHTVTGKIIARGNGGNDRLSISGNLNIDVEFYGGEGQDYLAGGIGNDFLDGGDSNDVILTGEGDNTALGGNGNDRLTGRSGSDTLIGQHGNDVLIGSSGRDVLIGDDLNDPTASGSDEISGGTGDDLLVGGPSNDILAGGFGNDVLIGGNGNDLLRGNGNEDLIIAGAGSDRVYGESGADRIVDGQAANEANQAALIDLLNEWTGPSTGLDRLYSYAGSLASDSDIDFLSGGGSVDAILFGVGDGNPIANGDVGF